MLVQFKLSVDQQLRAIELRAKAQAHVLDPEEGDVRCGNMLIGSNYGYGIRKQDLTLSDDNTLLTYNGARTALWDGTANAWYALEYIANGDIHDLQVVDYKTTAAYLHWWHKEVDHLSRARVERLVQIIQTQSDYSNTWREAKNELKRRSNKALGRLIKNEADDPKTAAKLAASFSKDEIKLERQIQVGLAHQVWHDRVEYA